MAKFEEMAKLEEFRTKKKALGDCLRALFHAISRQFGGGTATKQFPKNHTTTPSSLYGFGKYPQKYPQTCPATPLFCWLGTAAPPQERVQVMP